MPQSFEDEKLLSESVLRTRFGKAFLTTVSAPGLPDFSWFSTPKWGKIHQMTKNIPNGHEIYVPNGHEIYVPNGHEIDQIAI
jgi:arginine utilization protein RocB